MRSLLAQLEAEDALNDDTFGDVSLDGHWQQSQAELAKLHDEFLADSKGEAFGAGGGFFGNLPGGDEYLLEPSKEPSAPPVAPPVAARRAPLPPAPLAPRPPMGEAPLVMDAGLRSMLDDASPALAALTQGGGGGPGGGAPPSAPAALRVMGLPSTLDDLGARQLLTHFGALSSFELQRGGGVGGTSVATLSYQDPEVAQTAFESLQGIPLGGSTLSVERLQQAFAPRPYAPLPPASLPPPPPASKFAPPPPSLLPTPARGATQPQPQPQPVPPVPPMPAMPAMPAMPTGVQPGIMPQVAVPQVAVPQGLPPPAVPPGAHAALMQQISHLPPAQQHAVLMQMQRQQQMNAARLQALNERGPLQQFAPHPATRTTQLPHRVSERMTGAELGLIIRHQQMQVQMNDPVVDDFYHHFWVTKGNRSKAKPLKAATSTTSTERKTANNESIGASLGSGQVVSRTKAQSVRAPKPVIAVGGGNGGDGGDELAECAEEEESAGGPPMHAQRWQVRRRIEEARVMLIELRVHASSAAVMTAKGQLRRNALLQSLLELVQARLVLAHCHIPIRLPSI